MKTKKIILVLTLILSAVYVQADSPLTSCDFAEHYKSHKIVKTALDSKGAITQTMLNYLVNENNPIDVKVALINALGWHMENSNNADKLFQLLKKRLMITSEDQLQKKADAKTLIVYAYLKAMDNINDVTRAKELAETAIFKNEEKSFTVALIASIIQGQYYMDLEWEKVYQVASIVIDDKSLKKDMKQEAIDDIWGYLKIYEVD